MNKCQHCGAELTSKRAKNCDTCNALKADAMKWNVYSAVVTAMNAAQAAGMTGEDVHNAARDAHQVARGEMQAEAAAQRAEERAEKARKDAGRRQNALLARHGYTWMRIAANEEGADAFAGWSDEIDYQALTAWRLTDKTGATVTVAQALAAIAAKE